MSENLKNLFDEAILILQKAEVEDAKEDAKILLSAVLGIKRQEVFLHFDKECSETQKKIFDDYIRQRAERKPVSRILGSRGFWTLELDLNDETLDPRADSETLVEAVLENTKSDEDFRLLDLGTGTGCLPLAILSERHQASAVGIDISEKAVSAALSNTEKNNLSGRADFICADWNDFAAYCHEKFDVIISNPPYIPKGDISSLEAEVKDYDPLRALDGGTDGLDCYRQIANILPDLVKKGGSFYCEIGMGQTDDVGRIFADKGMKLIKVYKDLSGVERVLYMNA